MISCCVLLASAAFQMQFIKESWVRVRKARFKTGFPENTTVFCNFPLVFSEQDKLACVHLTVTPIRFAISPSIPTRHHPPKYLFVYCKTNWFMNQVMQLNHAQNFRSREVHYVWDSYYYPPSLPRAVLETGMTWVLCVKPVSTWGHLCLGDQGTGL